jgi:hypothetical protein
MRSLAVLLGTIIALTVVAARPAQACSKRHQSLFELYDLATDVAVAKVGRIPRARYAGPVRLRVVTPIKGARRATLIARENNTSCTTGFRAGKTALVFVSADREPTGGEEGYREDASAAMLAAMTAWGAATTADARLAVLVDTATGGDAELATEAAYYLVDRPELIARLRPEQAAALVAARGAKQVGPWITMILARQHGPAWRAVVAAGPVPAGPLFALATVDYEAITDLGVLADLIGSHPGDAPPERIAALERCERVHGHALTGITRYGHGHSESWWLRLAEACRTGREPSW